MPRRFVILLALLGGVVAPASADEPKKPAPRPKGDGHAVTFKPGDPKSPLRPRVSPAGTQIKLTATDLKVDGKDHLIGRIPLGPKELRGEGQLIALARTEAGKPYDLLFVDTNRDGKLTDEKAITTKPNLTRNDWWSSFEGTLKVAHAKTGADAIVDYPVSFWAVVEKPDQTPDIIRYSRRGFSVGTVTIEKEEYTVTVSDGNNDGVIGEKDFWAVSRTKNDDPVSGKFRVMPDYCWAGGKAWKLEMDGTAGGSGKLYPFDPGITQEADEIKRDQYKADRDAPRATKPVAFEKDYEKAMKRAAADKKPVFVKFETEWCGPCKTMTSLVFTAKDVADAADGVVCVKVDGDEQKELVKQYKVEAYPTGVLLDATGQEISRFVGYRGVKAMTEELKKLKK